MIKTVFGIVALLIAALLAGGWWFDLPQRFGWATESSETLVLYGNVDIREVELSFRVAGRIAEMFFEEGDPIETGNIMATLDQRPFLDDVHAAKAEVAAQEAILAKKIAGPRPEEIDQARAELGVSKATFKNAQSDLRRARELKPTGAITEARLDQLQAAQDTSESRVAAAQAALNLLLEGTRKEEIAEARANLAAASARLESAETALADTKLIAPSPGIVLSRVREPGAIVQPGETVYVVSLTERLWVRAYISETNLGRIAPGMKVEVVSDTFPNKPYSGHIGFISPAAEFTPKTVETPELRTDLVYRFRVIIDEKNTGLRQGMPVTVRIPRNKT